MYRFLFNNKISLAKLWCLIICVLFFVFLYKDIESSIDFSGKEILVNKNYLVMEDPKYITQKYFQNRVGWKTSNLGSILFKNVDISVYQKNENKTYVVLIWKYFDWLKNRHVQNFGSKRDNPLEECSVKNCIFAGNDTFLETADAVIVHLQHGEIPKVAKRNPKQRWVFLNDESPFNAFSLSHRSVFNRIPSLSGIFNWSMTYRTDSEVPVPYGRTIPLAKPRTYNISKKFTFQLVPNWMNKKRDVLATILMSNCGVVYRNQILHNLKQHISIDVYGKCSENNITVCPGHFKSDCDVMSNYLFYLVLENSRCRQYLTEKLFYNAYSKGAIPIISGAPLSDCQKLLPPNSFLHMDSFPSSEALAKKILEISQDDDQLFSYHKWRNNFEITNEHGYFGSRSYHFCRICEALNYNEEEAQVYDQDDLRIFLDPFMLCTVQKKTRNKKI